MIAEEVVKNILGSGVLVVMTIIFYFFTPKTISSIGYKTPMSMKNNETWNYANNLAKNLLLVITAIFVILEITLYNYLEDKKNVIDYSFPFFTISTILVIPIVEIMLNLKFDKNGEIKKK